jgi:amino acid transporter
MPACAYVEKAIWILWQSISHRMLIVIVIFVNVFLAKEITRKQSLNLDIGLVKILCTLAGVLMGLSKGSLAKSVL